MGKSFEEMFSGHAEYPYLDPSTTRHQLYLESLIKFFHEQNQLHASTRNPGYTAEVGFINRPDFNAFAVTIEDVDFIGIHIGLVETLIGLSVFAANSQNLSWVNVNNGTRKASADWIRDLCFLFVMFHEMGHVWNGHTSLRNKCGLSFINELNVATNGHLGSLDIQTMEMDADGFAAGNLSGTAQLNPFPIANPRIETEYGVGATTLMMTAACLHLLFLYFSEDEIDDDEEEEGHPPALVRSFMISGILINEAQRAGFKNHAHALPIVMEGLALAEVLHAEIHQRQVEPQKSIAAFNEDGPRYHRRYLRHWGALRPQLDLLKRGGILPEVQDVGDER